MNKFYFILGAIVFLNACSKDETSPSNTVNQTSSGEVKILVWWDKAFSDSMQAHGINYVGALMRRDGLYRYDTLFPVNSYWSNAPSCNATNVYIIKDELGSSRLFEVIMIDSLGYAMLDSYGDYRLHDSTYLTAGQCHQVKLPNIFQ